MTESTTYLETMAQAMRRDASINEIVTEFAVEGDIFRCRILRGKSEAASEIIQLEGEKQEENFSTTMETSDATMTANIIETTRPTNSNKKGPGF